MSDHSTTKNINPQTKDNKKAANRSNRTGKDSSATIGDIEASFNSDSNRDKGLLRTVTQYTEFSVSTGAALENKIADDERKSKGEPAPPSTNTYTIFSKEAWKPIFIKEYFGVVILLCAFVLSVFSIYWGSMYNRTNRLINLKVLIAVEGDHDALLSKALIETSQVAVLNKRAGWIIRDNLTELEVIDKIHEQKYWGSIYISQNNASEALVSALNSGTYFNTTGLVKSYYETGRDPNGMNSYVFPALMQFASMYDSVLLGKVYPALISNMTNEQLSSLRDLEMLTAVPSIEMSDGRPLTDPVVMAPIQIGLIFIVILTLFQFMWFMKLHGDIANVINPTNYIAYRMIILQVSCLFLSLAMTVLNSSFQVDYNKSWSGGFGVSWMFHYLCMSAVGGANENMAMLCFAILPPTMGFWMLLFIVSNVSATYSPIEVCPEFFRFTYAMPLKNAYELFKILFFDTTRRHLGRYIGILIAWIVANNILLPFCLILFSKLTAKRVAKSAKEIEARLEKNN